MKIAISGTYSSGKTTTTLALSLLTGIPSTQAKTMREILPHALPGKTLEEATGPELIQLGIRRLLERAVAESKLDRFISDGSSLHEWVYGMARTRYGLYPGKSEYVGKQGNEFFRDVMINFGNVSKDHAIKSYDSFIHLPIEFPLKEDGHRLVSEEFRAYSNELLINTLIELKIPFHVVGGSIAERLNTIIELYSLKTYMTVEEAILKSTEIINKSKILKEDGSYDN